MMPSAMSAQSIANEKQETVLIVMRYTVDDGFHKLIVLASELESADSILKSFIPPSPPTPHE
jgi:hypothetical protein